MRAEAVTDIERIVDKLRYNIRTAPYEEVIVLCQKLARLLDAGQELHDFTHTGYPSCSSVPKWDAAKAELLKEKHDHQGRSH